MASPLCQLYRHTFVSYCNQKKFDNSKYFFLKVLAYIVVCVLEFKNGV